MRRQGAVWRRPSVLQCRVSQLEANVVLSRRRKGLKDPAALGVFVFALLNPDSCWAKMWSREHHKRDNIYHSMDFIQTNPVTSFGFRKISNC